MGNSRRLVGRTIVGVEIAPDRKAILFRTDKGDIVARADGGCCSSTWIEHIELPAMGFPALVIDAEDVNMPDLGSPDEYKSVAYYGFKIQTDKGDMLIDYRNESNGYYGGSLSWPGDYFYGGVYGQNVSDAEWAKVGKDE